MLTRLYRTLCVVFNLSFICHEINRLKSYCCLYFSGAVDVVGRCCCGGLLVCIVIGNESESCIFLEGPRACLVRLT